MQSLAKNRTTALRVLHIIDSAGLYGAERVLLELAVEQQKLNHIPTIVSIGSPGCGEKPVERAARERGLPVRIVRMLPGPNLRGALQVLHLARDEAADVLHSHGYKGDILLGFLPRRLRSIPLVATVHGYTDVSGLSRMWLYHRVDRLALRCADRVVLVHRGMTATRGLNRLHDRRWRVIENGIPQAAPVSSASSADTSSFVDDDIVRFCKSGSVVIGAIGRLSREKGFDLMLRAVGQIARDRDDVVVLILGEGRQRAPLERHARDLGLGDRVLMPGYRSNAKDYLRLFDVFVLPSLTEGLPIVLLEAMQAAVPIVASRVGGVPNVLDEGRGGLLVEPGDSSALARAILRCIDDRALASQLAEYSLTQSSSRFSSRVMAELYLELYLELYREVAAAG
ncbi:MAG: glycosyltransferase [Luteitalea sp.]|nr:glycosyltransferase [Luteitalea sp.]